MATLARTKPSERTASARERALYNELRGIPSVQLLKLAQRRTFEDHRATARDLWASLSLGGETKAAAMATRIGKVVSAKTIGTLLEHGKSGVHRAKSENRLLAFRPPGSPGDLFPAFQIENGKIRSWIPRLLAATGNGFPAIHFLVVQRNSLKGSSYFDLLQQRDDPELVETMLEKAEKIGDPARGFQEPRKKSA